MRPGTDFGDDTVCNFPSTPCFKADETGNQPPGGKNRVLFSGGRAHKDYNQPGDGAYPGIERDYR